MAFNPSMSPLGRAAIAAAMNRLERNGFSRSSFPEESEACLESDAGHSEALAQFRRQE